MLALEPEVLGVVKTRYGVLREDGFEVPVFGYRKEEGEAVGGGGEGEEGGGLEFGPAVLYFHGGGMIFGSAELFEGVTKRDVLETGLCILVCEFGSFFSFLFFSVSRWLHRWLVPPG